MRRRLTVTLLAALTLLAPTVTPVSAQPAPPSCPPFDDVTDPIAVGVGQSFTFGLQSNPTTGYRWELELSNLSGMFSVVGPTYVPSPPPQPGGPPLVGSGGQECWTFQANRSGTITLMLNYRRPFEPATTPPVRTKQITVIVGPASAPIQVPRVSVGVTDESPG